MKNRDGFSIVEVLIVVIVVILIGAIGWLAYTTLSNPKSVEEASQNSPVTVDKESDLDKVNKTLDNVDIEDSDSAELDRAVEYF